MPFSTTNLPEVGKRSYIDVPTLVVADNDANDAGEHAAKMTHHAFWMPPEIGDANDFHLNHGLDALAEELSHFIRGEIEKFKANR